MCVCPFCRAKPDHVLFSYEKIKQVFNMCFDLYDFITIQAGLEVSTVNHKNQSAANAGGKKQATLS
jgi:hypothetical protein